MKHAGRCLIAVSVLLGFCITASGTKPRCNDGCRTRGPSTGGSRHHIVRGGRSDPRDRLRREYGDLTRRLVNLRDRIKDLRSQWESTRQRWWRTANRMGDLTGVHADWGGVDDQLRAALALWSRLKNERKDIKDKYNRLRDSTPTGGSTGGSSPTGTPGPSSGSPPSTTGTPSTSGGTPPSTGGGSPGGNSPPPDIKMSVDDIGNALDLSIMMVDDPKIKQQLQKGKEKFDKYVGKYGWMLGGKKISLRAALKLLLSGKKLGIMDAVNLFE